VSDGVDLIVNGKSAHVRSEGTTPLLQVLRTSLGCAAAGSAAAPSSAAPAWC